MANIRVWTSLSDIETRLRRALGLVGEVGATFKPEASPVIMAGDALGPGCNVWRNRAWAWGSTTVGAPGNRPFFVLKAQDAVLVDSLTICADAAWIFALAIETPADADRIATVNLNAPLVENTASASDMAPILTRQTPNIAGPFNGIFARVRATGGMVISLPTRIALPAGNKLLICTEAALAGAANCYVTVTGRIF